MRKVLVVAAREYNAAVRTRSFLISLVLLPLIMAGSVLIQFLVKDQVDTRDKRFAVIDRTSDQKLVAAIEAAAKARNDSEAIHDKATGKLTGAPFIIERVPPSADSAAEKDQQRFELSERVRKQELFGFLEIGADVIAYGKTPPPEPAPSSERRRRPRPTGVPDHLALRYQSNTPTYGAFSNWAESVVNAVVQEMRYAKAGLPKDTVKAVQQPVPVLAKSLSNRNPVTGKIEEAADENEIASILAPGGLMMLMFMLILVGTTPLMQGVVEEKMQRIAEVLLGSIRPFELMLGKLTGLVGVSLTLSFFYLGGAYWAAHHYGFAQYFAPHVMIWFIVFQILGLFMYGSLFIAVGAACTDLRETQTMLWPVMVVAMAPMFVWFPVVSEPNSPFAIIASLVPTATPMLLIVRQAIPPGVPWWQPVLGVTLVTATTFACIYLAGRIFRVGLLMQGKGANVKQLAQWVFQG